MRRTGFPIFLLVAFFTCKSFAAEIVVDDTLKGNVNSKVLLFPFFLKSPETNWGFGTASAYFFKAKKNDRSIRTSDLNLVTLFTLRQQIVAVLGSTVYFPGEKEIFRLQTSYSYYPDKFWGIGNNTLPEAQEDYSIHQFYFNPQLLRKLFYNWYVGVSYEYQSITDFSYEANGVFDRQNIAGRYGGKTSGLGLLLTWDSRNNAYSPTKGSFVELNTTSYNKNFGSDFSFSTATLDLRKFVSLTKKTVLATQLIVKDNTDSVPIRNLALLGGPEMMRGYYKGRFADKDLIAAQAELRQFLFWRLGATIFAGIGEVSERISEFRLDGFHAAWGAGLRIMVNKTEKLNLRVDYGFGKKSNGLYVILKEAF